MEAGYGHQMSTQHAHISRLGYPYSIRFVERSVAKYLKTRSTSRHTSQSMDGSVGCRSTGEGKQIKYPTPPSKMRLPVAASSAGPLSPNHRGRVLVQDIQPTRSTFSLTHRYLGDIERK